MNCNRCLALVLALAVLCALPVGCAGVPDGAASSAPTPASAAVPSSDAASDASSAAAASGPTVGEISDIPAITVADKVTDLMSGITKREVAGWRVDQEDAVAVSDFALRLFRQCEQDGKNTLVSPLSVLAALGMTANGAAGNTLAQMETTFGLERTEVNNYFLNTLSADGPLKMANAVWYNSASGFAPKQAFLQANADYYGAGACRAPFDESTRKEINDWVKTHTDGMIPEILDQIPGNAVMYLVNALAFEAKWREPFNEVGTAKGTFTREDGVKQTADFMHKGDEGTYLENDKATGFIKSYADGGYTFAALLPKKGVSVADLVASLDGKALQALLTKRQHVTVDVTMPRFKCGYGTDLADVMAAIGMPDAFSDSAADFTAMGNLAQGELYIGRILHKAYIEVDECGTKAAAATAVEMIAKSAAPVETKTVKLDRPFVYMILDSKNVPVFIGTLMDAGA